MKKVGKWTRENSIEAMNELINEKLKWDEEMVKKYLTKKIFIENGLDGMLRVLYDNRLYNALKEIYPNLQPWELRATSKNFWTTETAIEAMNWLFNEKLKWSKDSVENYTTRKVFVRNNLDKMLYTVYKDNISNAVNDILPYIIRED